MKHNIPVHLGIIMDGNRRWAKARGLPTLEGHRRGYDKLKDVGEWCFDRGVRVLTVYAFSTENWDRIKTEISYLMNLFHRALTKEADFFMRRNVRIVVIGRREGLPAKVRQAADKIEARTKDNSRGLVQLAINYGGRAEIVDAARSIMRSGIAAEEITEDVFAEHLYSPDIPPPDLIIRTSGEQRLSGFLTWESAYSELYFLEKHWPDFDEQDLEAAFAWYSNRNRRFGR